MSWRVGFRINLKCTGRLLFYHACLLCVYVSLLVTQSKSKCWIPTFQAADILFYQWEIRFSQSYYRKPNCFIPRSQRISLASSGEPIQSCNLQSESNFQPHLKKMEINILKKLTVLLASFPPKSLKFMGNQFFKENQLEFNHCFPNSFILSILTMVNMGEGSSCILRNSSSHYPKK